MTTNQPIPWRRIGAESVAIVGSILLAFAIDAWWDARVEHTEEQAHLAALQDQFERTLGLHEQQVSDLLNAVDATRQLLGLDGAAVQANGTEYGVNGQQFGYRWSEYPPSRFKPNIATLFADPRLEGLLITRARHILNTLDRHEVLATEGNAILALIEKNLSE